MKISRDRFEQILSSYLDGEASVDELKLLGKCVRDDSRMASIYYRACRVHSATRSMYGKKTNFIKLDGVELPNFEHREASRLRIALEWAGVAVLMLLCGVSMWAALKTYKEPILPRFLQGDSQNISASSKNALQSGFVVEASEVPFDSSSIMSKKEIASQISVGSGVFSVIKVRFLLPLEKVNRE